jgi:hypothetical protein
MSPLPAAFISAIAVLKIVGKWTEKTFLGICRRIVKCLNIVQLEILRPTFKNFTLSATG